MSGTGPSQARWIGIFVLVLIISLAELTALILDYQNNRYLRQYVSDNLGTIIIAAIGLLIVAGGAGYVVSKKLGVPKTPGPRVPTFARIGSFVRRRYKLVIVFWILLFATSFPLSQQLSQVTTFSTSGGQSGASQSALAQNLMAQEFPHPRSNARFHLVRLCSRSPTGRKCQRYYSLGTELRSRSDRSHASTRTIPGANSRKWEPDYWCTGKLGEIEPEYC